MDEENKVNENSNTGSTPPPTNNQRKMILIGAYWLFALGILAILISLVFQITGPVSVFSPTLTQETTPNLALTATIGRAMELLQTPPTVTPTWTITPSPTTTRTPLPTYTPTDTLPPTQSPTPTASLLPPTLTPGFPISTETAYRLAPWSPSRADRIITLMQAYPETIPQDARGPKDRIYFQSYYYAALAEREALFRQPEADQAVDWRWDLAYHYAQLSDPRSGALYSNLIEGGLNDENIPPQDLSEWAVQLDPKLTVNITDTLTIGVANPGYIIKIDNQGGSAVLWATRDNQTYQVNPLSSDFNFSQRYGTSLLFGDITGDGFEEMILVYATEDRQTNKKPKIFDISQSPIREVFFNPVLEVSIGLEHSTNWTVVPGAGKASLEMRSIVYPPCPVIILRTYSYQEPWIELSDEDYEVNPTPDLESYCQNLVDQSAVLWGSNAAIQIAEALIEIWPPTNQVNTYPPDILDEWNYRLGLYYAIDNQPEQAGQILRNLIENPTVTGSPWITDARQLLGNLGDPVAEYQACADYFYCNARQALKRYLDGIPTSEYISLNYHLNQAGVGLRYTATFDFEDDGEPERWFTIRHSLDRKLELWIQDAKTADWRILYVGTVETNKPLLRQFTTFLGGSLVWIDAEHSISLLRIPGSGEAYIQHYAPSYYYSDITNNTVESALTRLFSGVDPDTIVDELTGFRFSELFACVNEFDCARYIFATALANELAGNFVKATSGYFELWNNYFNSPFGTMSRLKIEFNPDVGPEPTLTFTPTNTPTITPTPTNTATNTPTITLTHTPGPSPTPTITPTNTLTFTPGPSPTDTLSPTITQTPTITDTPTNTQSPTPSLTATDS